MLDLNGFFHIFSVGCFSLELWFPGKELHYALQSVILSCLFTNTRLIQ